MSHNNWILDIWRNNKTVKNAKIAFIILQDEDDDIPEDLMNEIIRIMKVETEFESVTLSTYEQRHLHIKHSLENRPKGITKSAVFDQIGKEWGIDGDSVKRMYYRKK